MGKITEISVQQKNKSRCNVFVDGEFSFALSIEIAIKYHLKKGMELPEELIKTITFDAEKDVAMQKAVNLVSKTMKTKKQLRLYLEGKGYSPNIIYYVIDKMTEYNYINDLEYAKRYIESTSYKQGKKLISFKLMEKGVSKTDIEQAFLTTDMSYSDSAYNLAEKRLKNKEITKENLLKTYKYLLSKGFSYEDAENAISAFKED